MSREQLAFLLWGERDASYGLKNLRNALSSLRSVLPIFIADRHYVTLNQNFSFLSDLNQLQTPETWDLDHLDALCEPYLNVIELDRWVGFSAWLSEKRALYQHHLISGMKRRAVGADAPLWYERILQLDPYDEEAYARLSELYQKSGRFVATARLVRDYSMLVGETSLPAVQEDPSPASSVEDMNGLCVRLEEQMELSEMIELGVSRCSFLWGEEGIGKSHLIECVCRELREKKWFCLSEQAIQGEERYSLNTLLRLVCQLSKHVPLEETNLSLNKQEYLRICFPVLENSSTKGKRGRRGFLGQTEFNPSIVAQYLAEYIHECASGRRPLLVFRGSQWLDDTSTEVLSSLLHREDFSIYLIFSSYGEARNQLLPRLRVEHIPVHELTLSRLKREQIGVICRTLHPDKEWKDSDIDAVERYSEGNPFYICEILRSLNASEVYTLENPPEKLFARRLMSLSLKERAFLDALAIFPGEVMAEELHPLTGLSLMEFSNSYEKMQLQGILKERKGEGSTIFYSFSHSRIKGLIAEQMTHTLHKALHQKRVEWLHSSLDSGELNRCERFRQLSYHYGVMGLQEEELVARVEELKIHYAVTHNLFPLIKDPELLCFTPSINEIEFAHQRLAQAESLLDRLVRRRGRVASLRVHERALLVMRGGYLCWHGEYASAQNLLKEALRKELQEGTIEGQLAAYEQLCYVGIQTDNAEVLYRASLHMYRLSLAAHLHPQVGMSARFLAICHLLKGNSAASMRLLQQSIRFFELLEEQGEPYTLSIIAATHYQGDTYMYCGDIKDALTCYLRCVQLVELNGLYRGLGLSLAKASYCYIRLGDYEKAETFLKQCDDFYNVIGSNWSGSVQGGGIAYSLYALIAARKQNWEEVGRCLQLAEALCRQMNKPLWRAILFWVKAEIIEKSSSIPETLRDAYFSEGGKAYSQRAERLFHRLGWQVY